MINALLDHLGVERATFVVHDLGGVVGVAAATERPERFAGLAATNSFAWPPEGRALRAMLAIVGSRTATATLGTARLVPRLTRGKAGVGLHYDKADRRAFFGPYRRRSASRNFHRAMRSARRATRFVRRGRTAPAVRPWRLGGVDRIRGEERSVRVRRPVAGDVPPRPVLDGAGWESLPDVRRPRRLRQSPP